jgi:hypothetical protein
MPSGCRIIAATADHPKRPRAGGRRLINGSLPRHRLDRPCVGARLGGVAAPGGVGERRRNPGMTSSIHPASFIGVSPDECPACR